MELCYSVLAIFCGLGSFPNGGLVHCLPAEPTIRTAEKDCSDMAPEKAPAFQFYPKDFLSDSNVLRMSMEARGIYITLLSLAWLDGAVPVDPTELARLVNLPDKQFAKVWPSIRVCFQERDGQLVQPRLEAERAKQADFRRRQSDRGSRGADQRWRKHDASMAEASSSDGAGNAQAMLVDSSSVFSLPSASTPNPLAGAVDGGTTKPKVPPMPESIVVDEALADQASAFLEKWQDVYANARYGAFYQFVPGRDWPKALDLVHGWPDVPRLALMADVFLRRSDLGPKNIPGTIGQFKHMASDCDRLLRENGR